MGNCMNRILKKILQFLKNIILLFKLIPLYVKIFFYSIWGGKGTNGFIVVQAWVNSGYIINFRKGNWGDDLNRYLIERLTGKKVLFVPKNFNNSLWNILTKRFLFIGSILTFWSVDNTIICGAGIKNPKHKVYGKPSSVLFVRGPKTREVLINQNIECPEIYGDPALLLPFVYNPIDIKQSETIILIINEATPKDCQAIRSAEKLGFRIVNMTNYRKWTEIIDIIISSKFVVSESLHGLIVAETYGIPNVWVELIKHQDWWNFKFFDFFESINKYDEESLKLYERFDYDTIENKVKKWHKGHIAYNKILEAFPFEIQKEFKKKT